MALARRHGNRVVVATATMGERGADDAGAPADDLAARRRRELVRSLAELGVVEHRCLGYGDGACPDVDEREAVERLAAVVREVDPRTIVTFGPDGMTGHPDHRAVSTWTTRAWELTGRRSRLWFATLTDESHRRWGALNDEVGLWSYGEPPSTAREALSMELVLDGDVLDRKVAALRAHRSQTAGLIQAVGPERFRDWWATESFRAA
jgi:LmbE family N-acetylglucosaminyl deacetylase